MNEETRNESTITVNEDQMKTPYPVEVQAILDELCRCISQRPTRWIATTLMNWIT